MINLSPEPFPINTMSLARTISHWLYVKSLERTISHQLYIKSLVKIIFHRLYIKSLAETISHQFLSFVGKNLDIITLAGKDLRITLPDKYIGIINYHISHNDIHNQDTQAISHHIEETTNYTLQVHNHAFKHFINQATKVIIRRLTLSSQHISFFISTLFYSFRCNSWII